VGIIAQPVLLGMQTRCPSRPLCCRINIAKTAGLHLYWTALLKMAVSSPAGDVVRLVTFAICLDNGGNVK